MSFREKQTHVPHLSTQKQKTKKNPRQCGGSSCERFGTDEGSVWKQSSGKPRTACCGGFFFPVDVDFNEHDMGVEPKIGVPENGWFIVENPIKMDDLELPQFLETPIYST